MPFDKEAAVASASLSPGAPTEPAIEGEGFSIDLTWLKNSQKTLKWADETLLSFIASHYKVGGKTPTEALGKLTREQAEDFVKEVNRRLEKQQPGLL